MSLLRKMSRVLSSVVATFAAQPSSVVRAEEDGSEMWLRFRRIPEDPRREQYTKSFGGGIRMTVPSSEVEKAFLPALSQIIVEAATALRALLGGADGWLGEDAVHLCTRRTGGENCRPLRIVAPLQNSTAVGHVLGSRVISSAEKEKDHGEGGLLHFNLELRNHDVQDSRDLDAFLVRPRQARQEGVEISGKTPRSLFFGLFWFLNQLQQQRPLDALLKKPVFSRPETQLRVWNLWDNADGTIERGYAGKSVLWPMILEADLWSNREQKKSDRDHRPHETTSSSESGLDHEDLLSTTAIADAVLVVPPRLQKFDALLRFLVSVGVNGIVLSNVNSCSDQNLKQLSSSHWPLMARNLSPLLEKWQMTVYLSVCFAGPNKFAHIQSDPLDPAVARWWVKRVAAMYRELPVVFVEDYVFEPFGGLLVKADSEGNQGPFAFNRTQAEGANMLGGVLTAQRRLAWQRAASRPQTTTLSPPPGPAASAAGVVFWRAFVYSRPGEKPYDRAQQAYDIFAGLDGSFAENVVVQVKNGPMDFQAREPVSPMFGAALARTNLALELQVSQEYLGQQIHVVGLGKQWAWYLATKIRPRRGERRTVAKEPTAQEERGPLQTLAEVIGKSVEAAKRRLGGIAGVSNVGDFRNRTGAVFAQANMFVFGRLSWNPSQTEDSTAAHLLHKEWVSLTFGLLPDDDREAAVVVTTTSSATRSLASVADEHVASPGTPSPSPSDVVTSSASTSDGERTVPERAANANALLTEILDRSWNAYEAYASPLALGFTSDGGGGPCAPATPGPGPGPNGGLCPRPPPEPEENTGNDRDWHYWLNPCRGYVYANYSSFGLGCERRGFAHQYAPVIREKLLNPDTTPRELLLFFHNVGWAAKVPMAMQHLPTEEGEGEKTLFEFLCENAARGVATVREFGRIWGRPEVVGAVDEGLHGQIAARFAQHSQDAFTFAQALLGYFEKMSGLCCAAAGGTSRRVWAEVFGEKAAGAERGEGEVARSGGGNVGSVELEVDL